MLFRFSHSTCDEEYTIKKVPMIIQKNFNKGKRVCVNASFPKSVFLFTNKNRSEFLITHNDAKLGPFSDESKASGFYFGNDTGAVEINMLQDALLSFGFVSFPEEQSDYIVTTNSFTKVSNEKAFYFNASPSQLDYKFDIINGMVSFIYNETYSINNTASGRYQTHYISPAVVYLDGQYIFTAESDYASSSLYYQIQNTDNFQILEKQNGKKKLTKEEIIVVSLSIAVIVVTVGSVAIFMKIKKTHDPSLSDGLIEEEDQNQTE